MFQSPISSEVFPLYVVYDIKTGFVTTMGTEHITASIPDGHDVLTVPYGMSPLRKMVDLKTKTLIDLPVIVDEAEERETLLIQVRQRRNALLAATDYLLMPDYPITAEQRAQVEAYRQALRNITEQGDLTAIVWPSPWDMPSANASTQADTTSA